MLETTTRVLILAVVLLISGCSTCLDRYCDEMGAQPSSDKIVVTGRPD